MIDEIAKAQMRKIAKTFEKFARFAGVHTQIRVSENGTYVAGATDCGQSVHGLFEWLKKQDGYSKEA